MMFPLHPLVQCHGLGISAIDTRAACLALTVRTVLQVPTYVETFRKGARIGVSRDGQPVGYAVRIGRKSKPERWTAFVYIAEPPFDTVRVGFTSEADVVAFIAANGVTPDYLQR